MADSPDYRHWIAIAECDLKAARLLAAQEPARFGLHVLFHCQQSAEKYLKACLRWRQIDFPKVHDFEKLLRICEALSMDFRSLGPATARLQPFAVQARYTFRDPQAATVRQAIDDATCVRAFCRAFMGLGDDASSDEKSAAEQPPMARQETDERTQPDGP